MKILDEIRQRAEAATPGPWGLAYVKELDGTIESYDVASDGMFLICRVDPDEGELTPKNQEFIAHSRTDIPRLVKALEYLYDLVVSSDDYPHVPREIEAILNSEGE